MTNDDLSHERGGYDLAKLAQRKAAPATDPVALAVECGAEFYSPPPLRAVRGLIFTFDQLAAFAARIAALSVAPSQDREDAQRYRWLCAHPDWHFIEKLCWSFVAENEREFYIGLSAAIDERRGK